jgi:hypothetical protein
MVHAACYQIYSRDAAALAAFLAYLLEVESLAEGPSAQEFVVATLPPIKIKSYSGPPVNPVPSTAESDALLWQVESFEALEQIMQRAAFFQYRQQQEGTAAVMMQSKQVELNGRRTWQMLDLDGRSWFFMAMDN